MVNVDVSYKGTITRSEISKLARCWSETLLNLLVTMIPLVIIANQCCFCMMRKMTINAPWSIFYEEFFMNSFHYEIFPGPKDSYKNILLNLVKPLQITYLTTDKMFF